MNECEWVKNNFSSRSLAVLEILDLMIHFAVSIFDNKDKNRGNTWSIECDILLFKEFHMILNICVVY